MNARYFDVDNYLVTASDLRGPWSEPVYLHSAGFDASILHDDDGRKYIVSLEWETRDGYEKPGVICLAEYDPLGKKMADYPVRIWAGGTDRGCMEAPHLTKREGKYYLMCAEGGTGYNHCVTMARADGVWGPYRGDPANPIITSQPVSEYERHDPDHLKPKYYNPDTGLQKAGHASYVETPAHGKALTKMEFDPQVYQHSAGLLLYYDNMNFVYLRKYFSQTLGGPALALLQLENGERREYLETRIGLGEGKEPVWMQVDMEGREFHFSYSLNGKDFFPIGLNFDLSKLSDEYCQYGEFTGTFVGMVCVDRMFHSQTADFDFFEYEAFEDEKAGERR